MLSQTSVQKSQNEMWKVIIKGLLEANLIDLQLQTKTKYSFLLNIYFEQGSCFDETNKKPGNYCTQFMDQVLNQKTCAQYAEVRINMPLPSVSMRLDFEGPPTTHKFKRNTIEQPIFDIPFVFKC